MISISVKPSWWGDGRRSRRAVGSWFIGFLDIGGPAF
jgi:hypothetical protein